MTAGRVRVRARPTAAWARTAIAAAAVLAGPVPRAWAILTPCQPPPQGFPAPCFVHQVAPWFSWYETLGVGARALGMGGAWGAIADEAAAVYWNPGGLSQLVQYEITAFSGSPYITNKVSGGPPNLGFASFFIPVHSPQLVFGLSFVRNLHTSPDYYFQQIEPPPLGLAIPRVVFPYIQENAVVFSFSAPFTFARGLSVGVNGKYLWYDRYLSKRYKVAAVTGIRGYSADVGFLWRTPLYQMGKEFALGLAAIDAAGQIRWGSGLQEDLPMVARLSFAYTIQLMRQEVTAATMDVDQVADPRYNSDTGRKLRLGFEQWFFENQFAVRGGYVTPFGYQGWFSVGATIRWEGFQFDFAYRSGDEKVPDHIPQSIYFQLTFRFGPKPEPPAPAISARADPRLFTPRAGEATTLHLHTENQIPIERWAIAFYDRNERLVRNITRPGQPPAQVNWAGEDNHYQVLPDGEYTYSFKVRDMDGRNAMTPPQRVFLTSPVADPDRDPTRLFMRMDGRQDLTAKEKEALAADAKRRMDDLVRSQTTPEAGPGWVWSPTGAGPWATPTPGGPAAAGSATPSTAAFGFPAVASENLLDAFVATNPDNSRTLALDFISETNNVRFILSDVVKIARNLSGEAGPGVSNVDVRAHYGDNVLRLNATSESLQAMSSGRITPEAWLSTAYVTVNGQQITPSF